MAGAIARPNAIDSGLSIRSMNCLATRTRLDLAALAFHVRVSKASDDFPTADPDDDQRPRHVRSCFLRLCCARSRAHQAGVVPEGFPGDSFNQLT